MSYRDLDRRLRRLEEILGLCEQWQQATMGLDQMEFSVRAGNGLRNIGVTTIDQLKRLTYDDLLHIPNFGPKSRNEVMAAIRDLDVAADEYKAAIHELGAAD